MILEIPEGDRSLAKKPDLMVMQYHYAIVWVSPVAPHHEWKLKIWGPDHQAYFLHDDMAKVDLVERSAKGDSVARAALIFFRDHSLAEFMHIVLLAFPITGPIDMRPLQGDLF